MNGSARQGFARILRGAGRSFLSLTGEVHTREASTCESGARPNKDLAT
jgi:hypothetical protein